jgi:hypothetical protein
MMVPLPETVLKSVFWNTSQHHIALDVRNIKIFIPSGHFLILESSKNCMGLIQVNKVDGPF